MPKRVLDFDALWASDKIASCPAWAQAEYAWFYGLADASGSFELTNLRVIWGRVAAVRKDLTIECLEQIFQEFIARGLLFTWEAGGKRYGHWTGSDVPGRLPPPSWRARLERLAPPVPKRELAAYMARFASRRPAEFGEAAASTATSRENECDEEQFGDCEERGDDAIATPAQEEPHDESNSVSCAQLKLGLEQSQAQEWDKDWKEKERREVTPRGVSLSLPSESGGDLFRPIGADEEPREIPRPAKPSGAQNARCAAGRAPQRHEEKASGRSARNDALDPSRDSRRVSADELLAIYERERGNLPAALALTPERRRQCAFRVRVGLRSEEFAAAVRRAAATPFLTGDGARGWRANFDWFIANDTNVRKVLEGVYEPVETRATTHAGRAPRSIDRVLYSELHVGSGPVCADSGARVRPEALERARAREAGRRPP